MVEAGGPARWRPLAMALLLPVLPALVAAGVVVHARVSKAPALSAPPPVLTARSGAAMAYDPERHVVVLFGGQANTGTELDDTWVWDGERWHQLHPASAPSPQSHAALAWDPALHRLVLFGGSVENMHPGSTAGTWTWDGRNWEQDRHGPLPEMSGQPALAYDQARRQLVLAATAIAMTKVVAAPSWTPAPRGMPMSVQPTVTWTTTLRTWIYTRTGWVEQAAAALPGGLLGDPALGFDPVARRLVLFERRPAGFCTGTVGSSVAVESGTSLVAAPSAVGTHPSTRPSGLAAPPVETSSPVSSMCGLGEQPPVPLGPRWWDGTTWHRGGYRGLQGAVEATPVQDAQVEQLTVVQDGELWAWTGQHWTRRSHQGPFGERFSFGLATDPARANIVLVGGDAEGTTGSDTWTWDGQAWTYRAGALPGASPVAKSRRFGEQPGGCAADLEPIVTPDMDGAGRVHLVLDLTDACVSAGLKLQLVDRGSRRPLAVDGNDTPIKVKSSSEELVWQNWCARPGELAGVQFDAGRAGVVVTVLMPPPCLDPHQGSSLRVTINQ